MRDEDEDYDTVMPSTNTHGPPATRADSDASLPTADTPY